MKNNILYTIIPVTSFTIHYSKTHKYTSLFRQAAARENNKSQEQTKMAIKVRK